MGVTVKIRTDSGALHLDYKEERVLLSRALRDAGLTLAHPCGGHGRCGKCAVRASGELSPMSETERDALIRAGADPQTQRLACLCEATGATLLYYNIPSASLQGVTQSFPDDFSLNCLENSGKIGLAVDIGTTTVAAYLYDLTTGQELGSRCVENPQKTHGADVISRIGYALEGGANALRREIEDCIAFLSDALCRTVGVTVPDRAVVVGNTTMLHLISGVDVKPLSAAPFLLDCTFDEWVGVRYYPPVLSAYVGADMTAAILASGMCRGDQTVLLLDVGTNGEMALFHKGKLYVCSTAAGPAFEGAGISCGVPAIPGAIRRVWVEEGRMRYATVDDHMPPVGLCGTGLIDTAAALLELDILEDSGFMEEDAPIGDSGLTLTRADIRQLQLAKAAIRAGVDTLLYLAGVEMSDVDRVDLAGGFGTYLPPESCAAIGLIPQEAVGKIRVLGNAAGRGAIRMLLSEKEIDAARRIAQQAQVVELSGDAYFMERYVESMMF